MSFMILRVFGLFNFEPHKHAYSSVFHNNIYSSSYFQLEIYTHDPCSMLLII